MEFMERHEEVQKKSRQNPMKKTRGVLWKNPWTDPVNLRETSREELEKKYQNEFVEEEEELQKKFLENL